MMFPTTTTIWAECSSPLDASAPKDLSWKHRPDPHQRTNLPVAWPWISHSLQLGNIFIYKLSRLWHFSIVKQTKSFFFMGLLGQNNKCKIFKAWWGLNERGILPNLPSVLYSSQTDSETMNTSVDNQKSKGHVLSKSLKLMPCNK